jgi:hypothetical protein
MRFRLRNLCRHLTKRAGTALDNHDAKVTAANRGRAVISEQGSYRTVTLTARFESAVSAIERG